VLCTWLHLFSVHQVSRPAWRRSHPTQQKAEALASRASTGSDAFVAGQKLYERGRYSESVLAFEEGVRLAGFDTQLGGEVRRAVRAPC
jgi:hypothetical protein